MSVNVELLDRAVAFVRAAAEAGGDGVPVQIDGDGEIVLAWDQEVWTVTRLPEDERAKLSGQQLDWEEELVPPCGTACCLAGWVAIATGAQVKFEKMDAHRSGADVLVNGERVYIREYALNRLGLSEAQATVLFSGGNTAADIKRWAEAIKAGIDDESLWAEFQSDRAYNDDTGV